MRLMRLRHGGLDYWARLYDDATARLWTAAPWEGGTETDRLVPIKKGAILPPVTPSKIVCVGRNYREHAKELGHEVPPEPLLFMKPPSALLAHEGTVLLPPQSSRVEHEGELAVVVGATLRRADVATAARSIGGITCANDVTARDLQRKDVQFTRAKSFDTFCPIGPWLETEPGELASLSLRTRVNGETRQDGRVADMVWPVAELLAYVSSVMTLLPGDVLLTGTPAGVGPLAAGDVVEVEITGVGTLTHRVATEPA
ncbi:fumarylacetoacetate hydrolase family protein [Sandaracinus amylolyticus]|nr:fumarylacetoacetate hydrolase family protein [Sandaracinus amylolyticus]